MSVVSPRRSQRRRKLAPEDTVAQGEPPVNIVKKQEEQHETETQEEMTTETVTIVTIQTSGGEDPVQEEEEEEQEQESLVPQQRGSDVAIDITDLVQEAIISTQVEEKERVSNEQTTFEVVQESLKSEAGEELEDEEEEEEEEEEGEASKSKWKYKYDKCRRYRPEWEKRFPWLTRESEGAEFGFCIYCRKVIRPRLHDVEKHGATLAHTNLMNKMEWEKKQKIILGSKPATIINPRGNASLSEEERVQKIIRGIKENQESMRRVPSQTQQQSVVQAVDVSTSQPIQFFVTPIESSSETTTTFIVPPSAANTLGNIQVVSIPAPAPVITSVPAPATTNTAYSPGMGIQQRPKKYYPDPVSTYIVDQTAGCPAEKVAITLWQMTKDRKWSLKRTRHTNSDGLASAFLRWEEFSIGSYKLHFGIGDYYKKRGLESFFPYAEVVFEVKRVDEHFHVPLILSPYGYTTFKGN